MPRTSLPDPVTKRERVILRDVHRIGWAIQAVPDGRGSWYVGSTGLFHSFRRPEVVLTGADGTRAASLIYRIAEAAADGEDFHHGRWWDGVPGLPLFFLSVSRAAYPACAGDACWLYGGTDFPLLQAVVADRRGRFPWDPKHDPAADPGQFLLGKP